MIQPVLCWPGDGARIQAGTTWLAITDDSGKHLRLRGLDECRLMAGLLGDCIESAGRMQDCEVEAEFAGGQIYAEYEENGGHEIVLNDCRSEAVFTIPLSIAVDLRNWLGCCATDTDADAAIMLVPTAFGVRLGVAGEGEIWIGDEHVTELADRLGRIAASLDVAGDCDEHRYGTRTLAITKDSGSRFSLYIREHAAVIARHQTQRAAIGWMALKLGHIMRQEQAGA